MNGDDFFNPDAARNLSYGNGRRNTAPVLSGNDKSLKGLHPRFFTLFYLLKDFNGVSRPYVYEGLRVLVFCKFMDCVHPVRSPALYDERSISDRHA